ncbi:MAG: hypothetical protein P8L44_15520 [Opitutales bacterium]|nr:hypothetical protein [Opitutales bacterium]
MTFLFFLVVESPEELTKWSQFHPSFNLILLEDLLLQNTAFSVIAKYAAFDKIEGEVTQRPEFVISQTLQTGEAKWLQVQRSK